MNTVTVVAILATTLILVVVALAVALAFANRRRKDYDESEENWTKMPYWYVELWDISHGMKVPVSFYESVILGRGFPGEIYGNVFALHPDATIAREQCLLYGTDGGLAIKDLAQVNPTMRNGVRMQYAEYLQIGDRLTMGTTIFMVTDISYIPQ